MPLRRSVVAAVAAVLGPPSRLRLLRLALRLHVLRRRALLLQLLLRRRRLALLHQLLVRLLAV